MRVWLDSCEDEAERSNWLQLVGRGVFFLALAGALIDTAWNLTE